ncbi:hypothetical protein ACIHAA_13370 [Streptomyces sp. NPDC052040]|uniref:hypothetical protein n=1 Tax=Streptomyces sp. NPDC052040 TaxID=3365682 RepID=UPI0037CF0072
MDRRPPPTPEHLPATPERHRATTAPRGADSDQPEHGKPEHDEHDHQDRRTT